MRQQKQGRKSPDLRAGTGESTEARRRRRRRERARRWKHLVAPDQLELARGVVEQLNRTVLSPANKARSSSVQDYAVWWKAQEMFDALQPKEGRLFHYEPAAPDDSPERRFRDAEIIFERWAMETPVRLSWPFAPAEGVRTVPPPPALAAGRALLSCWLVLRDGGWRLITRCLVCKLWTVNASDKPEKRFCSPRCRVRWANRERGLRRAEARSAKPAPLSAAMTGGR